MQPIDPDFTWAPGLFTREERLRRVIAFEAEVAGNAVMAQAREDLTSVKRSHSQSIRQMREKFARDTGTVHTRAQPSVRQPTLEPPWPMQRKPPSKPPA